MSVRLETRAEFQHEGRPHVAIQVTDGKVELYRVLVTGESAGLEMFIGYLSDRKLSGAVKVRGVEALATARLAARGVYGVVHLAASGLRGLRFQSNLGRAIAAAAAPGRRQVDAYPDRSVPAPSAPGGHRARRR